MPRWGRPYLVMWQNDESTATRRLDDDGQELGIYSAEGGVPTALGDADVVVALLALQRLSVDVTKFGASHNPK